MSITLTAASLLVLVVVVVGLGIVVVVYIMPNIPNEEYELFRASIDIPREFDIISSMLEHNMIYYYANNGTRPRAKKNWHDVWSETLIKMSIWTTKLSKN